MKRYKILLSTILILIILYLTLNHSSNKFDVFQYVGKNTSLSICKDIKEQYKPQCRSLVYYNLARKNLNSEYCNKIEVLIDRNECKQEIDQKINLIKKKVHVCDAFSEEQQDKCLERVFITLKTYSKEICRLFKEREKKICVKVLS